MLEVALQDRGDAELLAERAGGVIEPDHAAREQQRAQPQPGGRLLGERAPEPIAIDPAVLEQDLADAHGQRRSVRPSRRSTGAGSPVFLSRLQAS